MTGPRAIARVGFAVLAVTAGIVVCRGGDPEAAEQSLAEARRLQTAAAG